MSKKRELTEGAARHRPQPRDSDPALGRSPSPPTLPAPRRGPARCGRGCGRRGGGGGAGRGAGGRRPARPLVLAPPRRSDVAGLRGCVSARGLALAGARAAQLRRWQQAARPGRSRGRGLRGLERQSAVTRGAGSAQASGEGVSAHAAARTPPRRRPGAGGACSAHAWERRACGAAVAQGPSCTLRRERALRAAGARRPWGS